MALTVEDGTGLAAANSYVSLEEALAYHSDHGNSTWAAATDEARSVALIRGSVALDGMYGSRWPGIRYTDLQGLDWPRSGAWDKDGYPLAGVPVKVKNATCEAALVELAEAGALSKALERGGSIRREKIGPIETEYAPGAPAGTAYPAITQALSRIVRGSSGLSIIRV